MVKNKSKLKKIRFGKSLSAAEASETCKTNQGAVILSLYAHFIDSC